MRYALMSRLRFWDSRASVNYYRASFTSEAVAHRLRQVYASHMSTPPRRDAAPARSHDDTLLAVAQRYYFAQNSMVAIADELGISRFRVARLLEEAERRGAVRITLHRPTEVKNDAAAHLRARYGLRHAVVVSGGHLTEAQQRSALGRAGATLLQSLLADGDVLGVGWGRAVEAVADMSGTLPRCKVVQLSGITGHPNSNSMELVRRFSTLTGGDAYPLYAPLLSPNAATAASLRESDGIAETFALFREVSVAIVAIGSWNPPNSQLHTVVSPATREILTAAGLQSEIGGVFLDAEGQEIQTSLSDQIMSISAAELAQVPTVIAVAGGASKACSIRAALKGGYINALVTDQAAARHLLT